VKRTVKPASGGLALQLEQQHGRATQTVTAVLQNRAMAAGPHGFRRSTPPNPAYVAEVAAPEAAHSRHGKPREGRAKSGVGIALACSCSAAPRRGPAAASGAGEAKKLWSTTYRLQLAAALLLHTARRHWGQWTRNHWETGRNPKHCAAPVRLQTGPTVTADGLHRERSLQAIYSVLLAQRWWSGTPTVEVALQALQTS
jgi:hypothetical protein